MAAVAPAGAGVQAEDTGFFTSPTAKTLLRSAVIYFAITYALGPNSPFRAKPDVGVIIPPVGGDSPAADGSETSTAPIVPAAASTQVQPLEAIPLWAPGSILDVLVKLSTAEDGIVDFSDTSLPSVEWKGVEYANTKWSREFDTIVDVPESVQHNASLWADIFVTLEGVSPDPASPAFGEPALHVRKLLTRYMPKKKIREVKKLLGAASKEATPTPPVVVEETPEAPAEIMPIISYWHPNISLEIVASAGPLAWASLPEPLRKYVDLVNDGEKNAAGKASYFPLTWANDFWLLREHMNPINTTTPQLPLRITLNPASFMKWQIMASLDDSMKTQAATTGGGGGELDEVKRMLTETNPILLITTVIVTILHMLFEFLAFTSDITHWKNKKELVGVSVRTILTNVFVQLIILLYLVDNNENTSWMILGGQGVGLLIEAWKITKAVDIKVIPSVGTIVPYKLEITDKHVLTEDELKTQEFDQLAFKWVGWGTTPLLIGYTIYSMYYNEHRSWYSFVISTLTSFVYAFGFIQLIPQLIINYKLKSVAHMPMKTMTYKVAAHPLFWITRSRALTDKPPPSLQFFNTIVDDFFSFVIKMPILHRLACFRDDVVFVILLYQMYIYKVDPTRVNEYGQKLTEEESAKLLAAEKEAPAAIKAASDAGGKKGEKKESKKDQ
ncbi:hypothetical protein RQP46_006407 [Phenoliferia psychrophenolica]